MLASHCAAAPPSRLPVGDRGEREERGGAGKKGDGGTYVAWRGCGSVARVSLSAHTSPRVVVPSSRGEWGAGGSNPAQQEQSSEESRREHFGALRMRQCIRCRNGDRATRGRRAMTARGSGAGVVGLVRAPAAVGARRARAQESIRGMTNAVRSGWGKADEAPATSGQRRSNCGARLAVRTAGQGGRLGTKDSGRERESGRESRSR